MWSRAEEQNWVVTIDVLPAAKWRPTGCCERDVSPSINEPQIRYLWPANSLYETDKSGATYDCQYNCVDWPAWGLIGLLKWSKEASVMISNCGRTRWSYCYLLNKISAARFELKSWVLFKRQLTIGGHPVIFIHYAKCHLMVTKKNVY